MPLVRKIAFVSSISSAYTHRLVRGALSYAETRTGLVIRDFRVRRDLRTRADRRDAVSQLLAWKPDGILGLLQNNELGSLLDLVGRPCPVVSMSAVQGRPGVAVVVASFPAVVEMAVRHFRQQGLRSVAMLLLESEEQMQSTMAEVFNRIIRSADTARTTFIEVVDPGLLDDPELAVTPVPVRLAQWLRNLPKPSGIFCPQMGGGGYIIRVCQALGLRVPQDLAVIGMDDADQSLATDPTLTSIMPVGEKIGFEAVRILEQMMAGGPGDEEPLRSKAIDLHVRQSTGLQRTQVCDIAAALEYINRHACHGLSVAQLVAATQKVCGKTFHTHFKVATGVTPGEAIQRRQFEEARRLLLGTRLAVTVVARKCGFGGSSDFARRFRVREGMSPSAFRQQAAKR